MGENIEVPLLCSAQRCSSRDLIFETETVCPETVPMRYALRSRSENVDDMYMTLVLIMNVISRRHLT